MGIKPPSFDWQGSNLPHSFKTFRRYCELILATPTYTCKQGPEIVNYIVLWMGPQAVEIFDNWTHFMDEQRSSPTDVWEAFVNYFEPKSNFRLARFQLRELIQRQEEPINSYINRLKVQDQRCNFEGNNLEDNLLDQVIKGTAHVAVQLQQLGHVNKSIDSLQKVKLRHKSRPKAKNCLFCGGKPHDCKDCPTIDDICKLCSKTGHWTKACQNTKRASSKSSVRSKPQNSRSQSSANANQSQPKPQQRFDRQVNAVNMYDLSSDFESMSMNNDANRSEAYASLKIKPYPDRTTNLRGKVDTGAQSNILPLRTFPRYVNSDDIPTSTTPSKMTLAAYNGTVIRQHGTLVLPCKLAENKWANCEFYVAETDGPVIFGLPMCTKLGLVTLNFAITHSDSSVRYTSLEDMKSHFPDRFEGIGKFSSEQKLTLKDDANPIKSELDRIVGLEVIRPEAEPTDWVSSITCVTKLDGSLRICLDPKDLNSALKRGQHHTPTVEELTHVFAGATVFSKLDAKHGYWCIPLDHDSQLLTTFNSPFRRYCFRRLPFGLNVSLNLFQRVMDKILQGLPGVVSIADDIIVYASTPAEHSERLSTLFNRARERGLLFNPAKYAISVSEVQFFGNIYSKSGVRPDPVKVQAIAQLKAPTSISEIQSFLGMANHLPPFVPNLSDHTAQLRKLLQKDIDFQWHPEHDEAFMSVKQHICQAGSLTYFDPSKPSVIQVDASQEALDAALLQDGRPIAFASKSLTDTEMRYANIERELLACVFGAERFHTYIYGKPFVIESDHKPLEMISKKNLTAAPTWLQRMFLRLQRYDYDIKYKPGREMTLPDSLSRLPKHGTDKPIDLNIKVCYVQFSNNKLAELRGTTASDDELVLLQKYIISGFSEKQRDLPAEIRKYWPYRDEFGIENGHTIKGEQLMVPESLRTQYLETIQ
ncbi:uncharacterized protein [Palaemon carinicauda]|uniref:uncharacterized protein n=1 Tax=Palaemon carinicauda TaxID=392227 RepID=UPI0035B6A311